MTAMSIARDTARQEGNEVGLKMSVLTILNGAVVFYNDDDSGYASTNDGSSITLDAGDKFAGIAAETKTNSGAAGSERIKVYQRGTFLLPFSSGDSIGEADKGAIVYVNNTTDNNEVSKAQDGGVDIAIGIIVDMGPSANTAWVKIDNAIGNVAA